MERVDILGVMYDNLTMEEAVARIMELIESGKTAFVSTPNAEIGYDCINNDEYRAMINASALTVPDGAGVVLAAKILGTPVKQKVAGFDLAGAILPKLSEKHKKLFLLGAKPGIAERAAEKMRVMAPGIDICGIRDGFFKSDEEAVGAINAAEPDLIFVCLGAPKQEYWMHKNAGAIRPCVMMGLGGTLDGFAGEVKRAPDLFVKLNLEWFYRLIKQPSRYKRMMRLPKYIFAAVRSKLHGRKG